MRVEGLNAKNLPTFLIYVIFHLKNVVMMSYLREFPFCIWEFPRFTKKPSTENNYNKRKLIIKKPKNQTYQKLECKKKCPPRLFFMFFVFSKTSTLLGTITANWIIFTLVFHHNKQYWNNYKSCSSLLDVI